MVLTLADLTVIGLIAGPTMLVLVAVIGWRITYYGKRTLEVHEKTGPWLAELQQQVDKEMNKQGRTFEDVINSASKFSSVKSIQDRCERLHNRNEQSTKTCIGTAIVIIIAIIVNISSSDVFSLALLDGTTAALWSVNMVNFYQFHGDLSELERRTQFRKVV